MLEIVKNKSMEGEYEMSQQKDCNFGSGYQKGLHWDGNLTHTSEGGS